MTEPLHTFLFVDLAGYTAMTEAHGDRTASELAGEFVESVRDLMPGHDAERSNCSATPSWRVERIPYLPLGSAFDWCGRSGPAIQERGDWFGATVNVAARVSSIAKAGQVLITEGTRSAAGDLSGVVLHSLGEHRLRNVRDAVRLYVAESATHQVSAWPIDPVCRMAIDPERTAGRLIYDQPVFYFCSFECMTSFGQASEHYASAASLVPGEGKGLDAERRART